MDATVKGIPNSIPGRRNSLSDIDFAKSIQCTFYGECQTPLNILMIKDVEDMLRNMKDTQISHDDIPMVVGLTPLNKILPGIPNDISKIAEGAIQKLEDMELSLQISSDVASQLVTVFEHMQPTIEELCQTVITYKTDFISRLNSTMSHICKGDTAKFHEIIAEHSKSPFSSQVICDWIREKQKEMCNILKIYVSTFRRIPGNLFNHNIIFLSPNPQNLKPLTC